jgi:signal transduction histidine kinase
MRARAARSLGPLQRLTRLPAYLWAGVMVVAMLLVLALVTRVGVIPGAVAIKQAQVWAGEVPSGEGQVTSLPHVWNNQRRDWDGLATYRLRLPAKLAGKQTDSGLGLLLPRIGVRYRVLFNGQELAAECWRRGPGYCDAGVRSQFVALPSALMAAVWADNHIDIQLQGQKLRISGISPVWVGEADALHQRHRWLDWWQVDMTWMVTASAVMMGLLSLILWLRTGERLFGLLSGGLMALTVRLWLSTPVFVAGPFALWDYVHKLSFTWYCGFLYLFISELFTFRQGFVRRLVVAMMVVGPAWLLLLEWTANYQLYRWWTGVIVAVCLVALVAVIHRARWGMNVNQRLMVVVGVAVMVTGLRDFLVVQLGLPGDVDIRWMTPGSLVLMFAMGWVLVRRATVAMEQVARHNTDLSRRVGEREAELHSVFDRLRVAENQRVLEAERRRLTRDMHDGLGSQLVQTLNLVHSSGERVSSAAVAPMLSHALEDLRMTLDSLEPMEGDLTTILGTLRQRISPTLQAANIDLVWEVEEVSTLPGLEARGVLHLFRCLQEVFANVVKHAQASQVTVRTREMGGRVELSVCDNGIGLGLMPDQAFRDGGRGIGNLRLRAAEIGADVRFSDGRPGACVSFSFPVQSTKDVDSKGI